jgi:hypothetical protein
LAALFLATVGIGAPVGIGVATSFMASAFFVLCFFLLFGPLPFGGPVAVGSQPIA